MVLIGGTSNVGKSSIARVVAERLGFVCRSTDQLARHPGRPWRTPEREVPPHVAEHYAGLAVDELIVSVLGHYARLWPRIEELITEHASGGGPGLVLEGSALWPARVAKLAVPHTASVWLTADMPVLRERIRTAGRYAEATDEERFLMDQFAARTERYQVLMQDAAEEAGLPRIDAGDGRSVVELAGAVLALVGVRGVAGGR
ncbi:MAG: hypothetical protein HOV68_13320 [Streptomycetaceae bacterium]|nr:hypothetical protein [Streptomycetaceae bacterium]